MWLVIFGLFCILATTFADTDCHACIASVCYNRSRVLEGYFPDGQIAIDRTSNIFYFHLEDSSLEHHSYQFNLDKVDIQPTPNINFSIARTVDQTSQDYYVSSHTEVHKITKNNEHTVLFDKKVVWYMQFKKYLYYAELEDYGIYIYKYGMPIRIAALIPYRIGEFVVDKYDDIYFTSELSTYRFEKSSNIVTKLDDKKYTLATDDLDEVYFVQPYYRGFYKWDYTEKKMIQVGAFAEGKPFGLLFDKYNNIICSDNKSKEVYYLRPNIGKTCSIISSATENGDQQPFTVTYE